MIEYLLVPPIAEITTASFILGFILSAALFISVVLLLASIIEQDPWHIPTIAFIIGASSLFILLSGIYKNYEPLPEYKKESCVLFDESVDSIKPYKSTTTYAVGMKTYKNAKYDETFTIRANHGTVYPKDIVCYRVVREQSN